MSILPSFIPNIICNREIPAASGRSYSKYNPATGAELCKLAGSGFFEVEDAVLAGKEAQKSWGTMSPVARGNVLYKVCDALARSRESIARIVAEETGKSFNDALGETDGAIALGRFYAAEGQRLFGRTTGSGIDNKHSIMMRQPVGVAGLIIAANTPIANVAWKVFPALACGNAAILKASEDSPGTGWIFGKIATEYLPEGILAIIQGMGAEAGQPIVEHPDVGVVSFTGSTAVGRLVAEIAGRRLAKVSLELGGKNPLVVCDDADLEKAVKWTILSAFSNAGQRCASASRIIVFDAVYNKFKAKLVEAVEKLVVGSNNEADLGPVINSHSLDRMEVSVQAAIERGALLLTGGARMDRIGYYMKPTLLENVPQDDPLSLEELFGPIAVLYRAENFDEALLLANDSPYGLTSGIHTKDLNRAWTFSLGIETGMCTVNGPTYGSEPHMSFGGLKSSGNGTREPGPEALDIYCEWKNVLWAIDLNQR